MKNIFPTILQYFHIQMQNNLKKKPDQLWGYLQHVPNTAKKSHPILKRKSEVTDKQVLNLTGGLFPLKVVDPAKQIGATPESSSHWVYAPIKQKNTKIGPIYHWVKQGEQQKLYHGQKFNIEARTIEFSKQQYLNIQVDHSQWPFQSVVDLFAKLRTYNFNFIVVEDRLQAQHKWNVEDLKEIYFTVTRLIAQNRGEKDTPRSNYIFDKKYEINRKFQLEKYMMRSKIDTDREKHLINQIRRLDIQIKKQEREQIHLKKVLRLEQVPDEIEKLKKSTDMEELYKNQRVFTRQQLLGRAIGLPGKIEEKMKQVLDGLSIPEKVMATKQNAELYDNLRKKVLLMFSLNRYIRKKQNEKKLLQDKKKRVFIQEQEQRNNKALNPLGNPLGQPKKKHKA